MPRFDPPPYALTCKNPEVGHDWHRIPTEWVPNTAFASIAIRLKNQRCGECGLVVCRMMNIHGNRVSVYRQSTYPDGYKWAEGFEPTPAQLWDWYDEAEERGITRRRKLTAVA